MEDSEEYFFIEYENVKGNKFKLKYKQFYCKRCNIKKKEPSGKNKSMCDSCRVEYHILYKLKMCIRSSIQNAFKKNGYKKSSRTYQILGCSFEEFKIHIESKFESWMTWENKSIFDSTLNSGWDLDHIIPISTAKTEEDIIKLNHYTNFQPLCSYINRYVKRDKIDEKFGNKNKL